MLGVKPLIGRVFNEQEDRDGARVALISYGLWQRRYGGSPDVLGRKIDVNDTPYEVIGVMPREFYFLPMRDIDLWMPASFPAWMRTAFGWHDEQVVARLKTGVTPEQAEQSMAALSLQITAKTFPRPHRTIVTSLREDITGETQTALVVLLAASVALLLIACVNLANLLSLADWRAAGRWLFVWRSARAVEDWPRNSSPKASCSPDSGLLRGSRLPCPRCDFSPGLCRKPWVRCGSRRTGVCSHSPRHLPLPLHWPSDLRPLCAGHGPARRTGCAKADAAPRARPVIVSSIRSL